jgi:hypothetical protein
MNMVTLEEFIAEIETNFSIYSATNDIDKVSIKTWVINELRQFGKNICDKRETILDIKNSRVLLPETFKSLILAVKLEPNDELGNKPQPERKLIIERQRLENPAEWTTTTRDYFVNFCETKIITEKVYAYEDPEERYYNPQFLSLVKGIQKDTLDVDCLNLHPSIRDNYPHKISITNRTLNTNFKEGKIYIQYNSLPADQDGEIAIPIISTGDIKNYIENKVKIKIGEDLMLNQKNPAGLPELLRLWFQQDRLLEIKARSEANWSGIPKDWSTQERIKNTARQDRFNLPRY